VEAREVAQALVARGPAPPSHRALLAEIHLELGAYDSAGNHFALLRPARAELAVAPRLARWAELRGRTDEARRLLHAARDEARRRPDLPPEQLAWFHLRVADLELRNGRLHAAERALRDGLAVDARDRRLLAGMARLAAARGDWRGVLAHGGRAGGGADIATLALMGDAHRALGDAPAAERMWAEAERAAAAAPEPFNRQWTQFRLDHGRRLGETLGILRQEIRTRPDVYGWDQLAMALLQTGHVAEARAAMAQALRLGTRDAMLFAHAARVARAAGDADGARRWQREARAVNPHLPPLPDVDRRLRQLALAPEAP
jgi:tetratricopeptide (TPR) repeat protein